MAKITTMMKTTLPDGSIKYVIDDTDLDDELFPTRRRGKLIIPHLIVCILIGAFIVFGIAAIFCI